MAPCHIELTGEEAVRATHPGGASVLASRLKIFASPKMIHWEAERLTATRIHRRTPDLAATRLPSSLPTVSDLAPHL